MDQLSLIANRYSVVKSIGRGGFGEVFAGLNIESQQKVAIKMDEKGSHLRNEYKIYKLVQGLRGFPNIYYYGPFAAGYVLVMDRLGPSLSTLFKICNCKMSLKTVLMIADQMIRRLEVLHDIGLVHRDIKLGNFIMGRGKNFCKVYIIDFGLAQRYCNAMTKEHLPQTKSGVTGTFSYMPITAHQQLLQSRRDDMESLGYVLVHLLKGKLPWIGLKGIDKHNTNQLIYKKKLDTPLRKLCEGLPREFEEYMHYCRNLAYDERPNYKYLVMLFRKLFNDKKYQRDYHFEWMLAKSKKKNAKPNGVPVTGQTSRIASKTIKAKPRIYVIGQTYTLNTKSNNQPKGISVTAQSHSYKVITEKRLKLSGASVGYQNFEIKKKNKNKESINIIQ